MVGHDGPPGGSACSARGAAMSLREVSLADRLGLGAEPMLINGNQAIVRALLLQRQRDRPRG
jgi:hypothetical protein